MGRQHVKGGVLTVHQAKTGVTVAIPIHPDLQAALAASEHLTFPTTATGKPFTGQGFTNWFRTMCRAAGLPPGLGGLSVNHRAWRTNPCTVGSQFVGGAQTKI
jgi:hypothetical protein